jgi:hypothetical protein
MSGKKCAGFLFLHAIGFAPKKTTQGFERGRLGKMIVKADISSTLFDLLLTVRIHLIVRNSRSALARDT